MGGPSTSQDTAASKQNSDWETSAINNWQAQSGAASSNINATLAAGNPYATTAYKTSQNLETSGAAHATDDAATEANTQAAQRTGQNAAAVPAQSAQNARNAQQSIDSYDAARDTSNDQAWEGEKQNLLGDQVNLSGQAGSVAGSAAGATNTANSNLETAQQADNQDDWQWLSPALGSVAPIMTAATKM